MGRPGQPDRAQEVLFSCTTPQRENSHLRRRTDSSISWTNRKKVHGITETLNDFGRPCLEFLTGPLETVVLVTELARMQCLEFDVVFCIGCCHNDGRRPGKFKEDTLKS